MMCAVLWCLINAYGDPSSVFFKPSHAFSRVYSAIREDESAEYIYRVFLKVVTPDSKVSVKDRRSELVCISHSQHQRASLDIPSPYPRHPLRRAHSRGARQYLHYRPPRQREPLYAHCLWRTVAVRACRRSLHVQWLNVLRRFTRLTGKDPARHTAFCPTICTRR